MQNAEQHTIRYEWIQRVRAFVYNAKKQSSRKNVHLYAAIIDHMKPWLTPYVARALSMSL